MPAPNPLQFLIHNGRNSEAFGKNGETPTLLGGNVILMLVAGAYGAKTTKELACGKEVAVRTPRTKEEWIGYLMTSGVGSRAVKWRAVRLMDEAGFIDFAATKHRDREGKEMGRDRARRAFIAEMLQNPLFLTKGMAYLRSVLAVYYAAMPSKKCRHGLKPRIKSLHWLATAASVCRRFVNKAIELLTDTGNQFHIQIIVKIASRNSS